MVRVRDKPCNSAKDCERFDFEVGRGGYNHAFVERDVRVVFFVDVKVFDEAFVEEVIEG